MSQTTDNNNNSSGALGEYLAAELTAIIHERSQETQGKLERKARAEIRIIRKLSTEFSQEVARRNIETPIADESEATPPIKKETAPFEKSDLFRFDRLNSIFGW